MTINIEEFREQLKMKRRKELQEAANKMAPLFPPNVVCVDLTLRYDDGQITHVRGKWQPDLSL